jgi:hypothetical protein
LKGEEIFAVSNSISVTVKDVPLEGRPDSYIGGVGTFDVNAEMTPHKAAVGDPMTLSITIHGEGTMADIRAPDIKQIPEVTDQFRTYEATEETIGNGRVFTFALRPLSTDVAEFPAIPLSYFDVDQEKYVTLKTPAIPLTIAAATRLSTDEIVAGAAAGKTDSSATLEVNDAGLFANHSGLEQLRMRRWNLSGWLTVWGTMLAGYCGVSLVLRKRDQLHADPALRRRRTARSRATDALKSVRAAIAADQPIAPDVLSRIVVGLLADMTGIPEAGMTSQDAVRILTDRDVPEDVRARTAEFMDRCDAARYGAGGGNEESLVPTCQTLVEELGRELNRRC